MKRIATFCAAALFSLALAAPAWAGLIVFNVTLDGASEATPNASPGTGTGVVTFDTLAHTMRVQVDFSGLTGTTTNAHIHCCTAIPGAGTVGIATQVPTFVGFPVGVTAGSYDQTFDMTLASSFNASFITNNGGTEASAEAALLNGALGGRAYLNIHTTEFPGGEIRGFLTAVPEPASLGLLGAGLAGLALARRRRGRAMAGN